MSTKETKQRSRIDESASKKSGTVVRGRNKSGNRSSSTLESTEKRKIVEKRLSFEEQSKITKPLVTTSAAASLRRNFDGKRRVSNDNSRISVDSTRERRERRVEKKETKETSEKKDFGTKSAGPKVRNDVNPNVDKRGLSTIYKSAYIAKINSGRDKIGNSGGGETSRTSTTTSRTKNPSVKTPSRSQKSASTKSKPQDSSSTSSKEKKMNNRSRNERVSSGERRRSRTLSPSEVKVLSSDLRKVANSASKIDRPRVTKSYKNFKETNDPTNKIEKSNDDQDVKNEFEYEDDFEDYESDFEECTDSQASAISDETSTTDEIEPIEMRTEKQKTTVTNVESRKSDDERMLDSGHYEIAEARKRAVTLETISSKRKGDQISNAEVIVEQPVISLYSRNADFGRLIENREERVSDNKSLPSSMDEGFEDARSGDFVKSPTLSRITFADYRGSEKKVGKDKNKNTLESSKKISRGRKLLEMIKLDKVEWSIHECKPVAYEVFIRTHGKLNTRQVSVQTNEENLEVETQTDYIELTNKWTQFPVKCRSKLTNENDIKIFNTERLGVGSESNSESSISTKFRPLCDVLELNEFVKRAGKVMITILEDERTTNEKNSTQNDGVKINEMPFTENVVELSIDKVTFLLGRSVTTIHYSNVSNRVLLTIHAPAEEGIETTNNEDFVTDCSIGCLWNIRQPSRPIKLFYSPNTITACCFHSTSYNVVIGGLDDGSINLWDLNEEEHWHRKIVDADNASEWIVRSPTFSSVGNFDESNHDSEIVSIRVLSKIDGEFADSYSKKFMPIQICSLDANGKIIIWSVLRNLSRANVDDLGLSWWGDLRLVKSQEISMKSEKISERIDYLNGYTDMQVHSNNSNAFYVATNGSDVVCATRFGKRAHPSIYKSSEMDCGNARCIEVCPFNEPYFLVGCSDGSIRLHGTNAEKSLLRMKNENSDAPIKCIEWSKSKPLTFYVLDVNSNIHVWDLGNSDIFPIETIRNTEDRSIGVISLSSWRTVNEITNQYMAVGLTNGSVEVHKLKKGYHYSNKEAIKRETNTFLRYVAIL